MFAGAEVPGFAKRHFPHSMPHVLTRAILLICCSLVASCGTSDPLKTHASTTQYYIPVDRAPPLRALPKELNCPIISRRDCILTAVSYLQHQWTPSEKNVFHGKDAQGIQVDTPDVNFRPRGTFPGWWVPGLVNRSIPYQWGGFSTPEEFDAGIAAGKAAGDIFTPEKRAKLDDAVSQQAVGIDCSGFISRCWHLPRSFSTRELPLLCEPLESFDDLQPGDIVNTHNAHVVLFDAWYDSARSYFVCYETGSPPTWKVQRHALRTAQMKELGYKPFRYRNIR
jgi:hypothetical protein